MAITPPPPKPGIHLSLIQQGIDEGSRLVRLRVENITGRALPVRRVGVDWPGYGLVTAPSAYRVEPGATVDLPFTLPPARCAADTSARPVGVLVLKSRTIRSEVDDMGVRFADRWWRTGCALQRMRAAADLSYGRPWRVERSGPEPRLLTSVHVVRKAGDSRIALVAAQGTVLFDFQLDGSPALEPGERRGNLPLAITPGRCDQHARSQVSQPFTFRLNLQFDDDPQLVPVVLKPSAEQRRSLLAFLDAACG